MNVHFIDVGFGDAILIQSSKGETLLVDSGPRESSDKLVYYLHSQGISTIDKVILTHPHRDHFGGLLSIFRQFTVRNFYYNGEQSHYHEGFLEVMGEVKGMVGADPKRLKQSDVFPISDHRGLLQVLSPNVLNKIANNNALVLRLTFEGNSFLFTSDIELEAQMEVLSRVDKSVNYNVIQVPHHGGKMAPEFIDQFSKAVKVISTGPNEYKLPDQETLTKIQGPFYRTDIDGSILFRCDGKTCEVERC